MATTAHCAAGLRRTRSGGAHHTTPRNKFSGYKRFAFFVQQEHRDPKITSAQLPHLQGATGLVTPTGLLPAAASAWHPIIQQSAIVRLQDALIFAHHSVRCVDKFLLKPLKLWVHCWRGPICSGHHSPPPLPPQRSVRGCTFVSCAMPCCQSLEPESLRLL